MRKGRRALGPYPHRDVWHVVTVEATGAREVVVCPTERAGIEFRDEYNRLAAQVALTIGVALKRYEHEQLVVRGNKPGTWTETRRRIVRLVGDLDQELDAFTPRRAAKAYERLVGSMSVDAQQGIRMHAKTFFDWCKKKGWLTDNPLEQVEAQGKKKRGKVKLRRDEARRWLRTALEWAAAGEWRALMAAMPLLFDLRASEVLGLRVRDVDDDASLLVVEGTKSEAARRTLRIPEDVRPLLRLHCQGRDGSEPLFGEHDYRFVNFWVGEMCVEAKVPVITAQGMRGTHADLALEEGTSPEALARSMGHETFAVTAGHYVSKGVRAAAGVNKAMRVIKGGKG
jgi:integrase